MRHGMVLSEAESGTYEALGAFGQPVHERYVQLSAAIRQRLGPRYADFFARPQLDEHSRRIRWVAPVAGEVRAWRDLDREEQAARALDLQVMRSAFAAYLQELRMEPEAGAPQRRGGPAFAAVLDQALKTPNDGHLHFVGEQPVATFWGFREFDAEPFEPLTAAPPPLVANAAMGGSIAPDREAVPAGAGLAGGRSRWGALSWRSMLALLLPLALLGALFGWWWLRGPDGWSLPHVQLPALGDGGRRAGVLDPPVDPVGRVALPDGLRLPPGGAVGVERESPVVGPTTSNDDAPAATVAQEPTTTTEPPPLPPMLGEDVPELGEPSVIPDPPAAESATPDALPPEPESSTPIAGDLAQAPASQPPGVQPGEPLTIPEAALAPGATGGAGFLSGRWSSRSGLVDDQGRELRQFYELDQAGRGRSFVRRPDGVECSAPVEAVMEGGQLRLRELANLACPDGQLYERSQTVCERNAAGQTLCRGVNEDGSSFGVNIERAAP